MSNEQLFILSANNQLVTEPGVKPDFATGTPYQQLTDWQKRTRFELTYNWTKLKCTLAEIVDIVQAGYTISTWFTGGERCTYPGCNGRRADCQRTGRHRANANFQAAQILALDLDHLTRAKIAVLEHQVMQYAFCVYHTSSSTPTAPRLRALFALERPIVGKPESAKALIEAMLWKFGGDADPACSDICRIFYGNLDARLELFEPERVLPLEIAASWVREYRRFREEIAAFNQYAKSLTTNGGAAAERPKPDDNGAKNYARAVLAGVARELRTAQSRHGGLTRATMKIAPYVLHGYLSELEARQELEAAFGAHFGGTPRGDFNPAWRSAKQKANGQPYFPPNWGRRQ
jgi:hypothetical protein